VREEKLKNDYQHEEKLTLTCDYPQVSSSSQIDFPPISFYTILQLLGFGITAERVIEVVDLFEESRSSLLPLLRSANAFSFQV
jgi:hypothetical protein